VPPRRLSSRVGGPLPSHPKASSRTARPVRPSPLHARRDRDRRDRHSCRGARLVRRGDSSVAVTISRCATHPSRVFRATLCETRPPRVFRATLRGSSVAGLLFVIFSVRLPVGLPFVICSVRLVVYESSVGWSSY